MGLQKKLNRGDSAFQYEFPVAYFKISKIELDNIRDEIRFVVRAYADIEARQRDSMRGMLQFSNSSCKLFENTYTVKMEIITSEITETVTDSLLKALYLWLKKYSGHFSDAIDII